MQVTDAHQIQVKELLREVKACLLVIPSRLSDIENANAVLA